VAVLDLVDLTGAGVAAGDGHGAVVAAQGDPAERVGGQHGDGEGGEVVEEAGDVLGGEQQLLQFGGCRDGDAVGRSVAGHEGRPVWEPGSRLVANQRRLATGFDGLGVPPTTPGSHTAGWRRRGNHT
jgi:hypothetical protein